MRNARAEYRVEPGKKIAATVCVAEGDLADALRAESDALAFLARVDPSLLEWELTAASGDADAGLTRRRLRRRLASMGKPWPNVPADGEVAVAEAAAEDDGSVSLVVNDQLQVCSTAEWGPLSGGLRLPPDRLLIAPWLQARLPLATMIDADKERARLGKQKDTLEASLAKVSKRLNAPGFADKAKPEVVAKAQTELAEQTEKLDGVLKALARLPPA